MSSMMMETQESEQRSADLQQLQQGYENGQEEGEEEGQVSSYIIMAVSLLCKIIVHVGIKFFKPTNSKVNTIVSFYLILFYSQ